MVARRKVLKCSFCGKSQEEVSKLLAGPKVHICGQCVGACNDILAGEGTPPFAELSDLSDANILGTLAGTTAAADALHEVLRGRIDELRERQVSWAKIGKALGVSRQAAWERFS